jgi:hypothetical protein
VAEHSFDHGQLHDREHLFGGGECQGAETGSLAAHQDDGPHPFDPPGFVVVVTVGAVVEVGDVVAVDAGVVDEVEVPTGTVVAVGVVVEVVGPAWSAVIRLVMTVAGGFGMVTSAGTKAIVIS